MKLFLFFLISVLFVLASAKTKTCTGSRCKRMTNVIAKLYNYYDYGNGRENGGGSNNYQSRESDCPNCYATLGNDGSGRNIVNIEKK